MLPPVAEVYVVWHPDDAGGATIASGILDHFHGTPFTGLIGGAVEVYGRCRGWRGSWDAPRPIPMPDAPPPNELDAAQLVTVVPVLGTGFAASVERGSGPWYDFAKGIMDGQRRWPRRVGVFPAILHEAVLDDTRISAMLGQFTAVGRRWTGSAGVPDTSAVCQDLTQAIAQFAAPDSGRLTIFVSHTRTSREGEPAVSELVRAVRSAVRETRLDEFFDASTVQPGERWADVVGANAANAALLALRTDHYAGRAWCQKEMLLAKRAGMPIVILDALSHGDDRGSFLMDHVPRVPVRWGSDGWQRAGVAAGLHRLVSECLKRALWRNQQRLARDRPDLAVAWWAPHAPEPVTLTAWLTQNGRSLQLVADEPLRIIHPDPPLGPDEADVLAQLTTLAGVGAPLEIMTPRSLAARGG